MAFYQLLSGNTVGRLSKPPPLVIPGHAYPVFKLMEMQKIT